MREKLVCTQSASSLYWFVLALSVLQQYIITQLALVCKLRRKRLGRGWMDGESQQTRQREWEAAFTKACFLSGLFQKLLKTGRCPIIQCLLSVCFDDRCNAWDMLHKASAVGTTLIFKIHRVSWQIGHKGAQLHNLGISATSSMISAIHATLE